MRAYHNPNKTASFHVRLTPGEVADLIAQATEALTVVSDVLGKGLPALGVLAERLDAAQTRAAEGATEAHD